MKGERKESLFRNEATQRMEKSFDTAKDSWITQELRRITLTKIEEMNSSISDSNSTCFH